MFLESGAGLICLFLFGLVLGSEVSEFGWFVREVCLEDDALTGCSAAADEGRSGLAFGRAEFAARTCCWCHR